MKDWAWQLHFPFLLKVKLSLSLSTQSETFTFPSYSKWETELANFTFPFYSKVRGPRNRNPVAGPAEFYATVKDDLNERKQKSFLQILFVNLWGHFSWRRMRPKYIKKWNLTLLKWQWELWRLRIFHEKCVVFEAVSCYNVLKRILFVCNLELLIWATWNCLLFPIIDFWVTLGFNILMSSQKLFVWLVG